MQNSWMGCRMFAVIVSQQQKSCLACDLAVMKRTGSVWFAIATSDFVSIPCNHTIQELPQSHRKRDMENRSNGPQDRQSASQITNRISSWILVSLGGNDPHLLHHLIIRQIRKANSNLGIMQGHKRQSFSPVQPAQNANLRFAKIALSVEQDNIFFHLIEGHHELVSVFL